MAKRIAGTWLFRAEAMQLNWVAVLDAQRAALSRANPQLAKQQWPAGDVAEQLRLRFGDIHLWWACSADLGAPRAPFTVWARARDDKSDPTTAVKSRQFWTDLDTGAPLNDFGGLEVAVATIAWDPVDPGQPSRVELYRAAGEPADLVAVAAMPAGSGNPTVATVRCSGATSFRLFNGSVIGVRARTLDDVVNDQGWVAIETVGLPCPQPWEGTDYDTSDQGLRGAEMAPFDAAVERVTRGMPPLGWLPVTQTGRLAPPWVQPDPYGVVKDVAKTLLPEIEPIYAAGVPESEQAAIVEQRDVDGPNQDGTRFSSVGTTATIRPWSLLALPSQTDPVAHFATGFGTTYGRGTKLPLDGWPDIEQAVDFMVTADYSSLPWPWSTKGTVAAYAPQVGPHAQTAPPTGLASERAGLVGPMQPDLAWRESVRVSWDRLPVTAALGRVTAGVLARYETTASQAESLAPERDSGGTRPLALTADGAEGEANHDRHAFVDGGAVIPIGSGGRSVGYATALVDTHGIWSPWRDVAYVGDEPGPQSPRLISAAFTSAWSGTPGACPSSVHLEAAVDWRERRPTLLRGTAVFYPMGGPTSPPPGWGWTTAADGTKRLVPISTDRVDPVTPEPSGCFRRDFRLDFPLTSGIPSDNPAPTGCAVSCLSADGTEVVTAGPGQGDGGRRYALTVDVPMLDWTATGRWGVAIWLQSELAVGTSPTGWVPPASAPPATTVAASPVPIQPLPPPAPPGVPLGSTPDAQGRSHVTVQWSLPSGAPVRYSTIWECSESALLQRAGRPLRSDTDAPGVRLAALWALYDSMSATDRRAAFRRLREVDAADGTSADVALPKGSTDIHLFTVTTQSMTGIESDWPSGGGAPHLHLQAAIAPRLRRPAKPIARPSVHDDGTVQVDLISASMIPVARFDIYATRSFEAARNRESMGPAVASATGVDSGAKDPLTQSPIYTATWTGTLPAAWDEWYVRAVAKPVDTLPVEAVRGLTSDASEVSTLLVPPGGPPDLDVLTSEVWAPSHRGVVVRSSTSAPPRSTPLGSHRLIWTVGTEAAEGSALEAITQVADLTTAPAGTDTGTIPERGARAAGRTPLALWFTRPVAADPIDVKLRLVDPLGRATERTITVPGWVPPPPYSVTLGPIIARTGGVFVGLDTDASRAPSAGVLLHVSVLKRTKPWPPIPWPPGPQLPQLKPTIPPGPVPPGPVPAGPVPAGPVPPGPIPMLHMGATTAAKALGPVGPVGPVWPHRPPQWPLTEVAHGDFPLADIPAGLPFFPQDGQIHVVRLRPKPATSPPYAIWLPALAPLTVTVTVDSPDGRSATATGSI